MSLPVPRADEVARFKALYESKFKVTLSDAEAWEVTTKALQLYHVKYHAIIEISSLDKSSDTS